MFGAPWTISRSWPDPLRQRPLLEEQPREDDRRPADPVEDDLRPLLGRGLGGDHHRRDRPLGADAEPRDDSVPGLGEHGGDRHQGHVDLPVPEHPRDLGRVGLHEGVPVDVDVVRQRPGVEVPDGPDPGPCQASATTRYSVSRSTGIRPAADQRDDLGDGDLLRGLGAGLVVDLLVDRAVEVVGPERQRDLASLDAEHRPSRP